MLLHALDNLSGRQHVDEARASRHHALDSLLVRLLNMRIVEQNAQSCVALVGSWLPVNTGHRNMLGSQRISEKVGSDRNNVQRVSKEISHWMAPRLAEWTTQLRLLSLRLPAQQRHCFHRQVRLLLQIVYADEI